MIIYLYFLILSFLPLIEGELLGIGRFIFLAFCLPLVIYLSKRQHRVFNVNTRCLQVIFIAFLLLVTLSTIFSPVFGRSLSTLVLYFAYFIYFLGAQVLVKEKKELFKELLVISILFPSLVLCLFSFYFLIAKEPPPFAGMNLIFANFGHNHLVDFLIFAFPVSLILFFKEEKRIKKIFFLLLNLIFLSTFIFSFSRGGILMAFLEILLFVFIVRKTKDVNNRHAIAYQLFSFLMGLLLVLSLGVSIFGYYYFGQERIKTSENFFLKKAFREPPISSRLDYYRQTILTFKERPLFGWGLDNFRYLSTKYQSQENGWSWYSHNHFLQMFSETGIFGGVCFLLLTFFLLKNIIKLTHDRGQNRLYDALFIGILASLIHSLFDYDWQFPSVFLLFWVIVGYLRAQCHSESISESHKILRYAQDDINKEKYRLFLLGIGIFLFVIAGLEFSANILLFKGDYEKSLKIWPFRLDNWQAAVNYYHKNNELDKSLAIMQKLIVIEPISDRNYYSLAEIYKQKNQPDKAFTYYLEALKLNPKQENIYYQLIDLWPQTQNKNWQEFFNLLERLETAKGPYCLLKCLGFANEEKILNQLLQLIQLKEFNQLNKVQQAKVYYWLAMLTTYQKDWNQDIDFLQKAIVLDPKDAYQNFLTDLTVIKNIEESFWQEDFDRVEKLAKTFLKRENNSIFHEDYYISEAIYYLGQIALKSNQLKEGEDYFKRAIKINPNNDKAYIKLAIIFQQQNNLEESKKTLDQCILLNNWSEDCKKELTNL